VLVYMCEWAIWPVCPYRGPCIGNYISTLLELEEEHINHYSLIIKLVVKHDIELLKLLWSKKNESVEK
jgi:hypothetical protein